LINGLEMNSVETPSFVLEDTENTVFEDIMIWEPAGGPVPVDLLVLGMQDEDAEFVAACYEMARGLYDDRPPRKNGQPAFTHPTNCAWFLRLAQTQAHVVAAGLLHDMLEDRVDIERENGVSDAGQLDLLQRAIRGQFGSAVIDASLKAGYPREIAERVVEVVSTLTRHKSDLYYKSISGIFTHTDLEIRLAAALVKLADRMHNIKTIENYLDDEKIYQCYKNIFILNNAKQLRNEIRERATDERMVISLEKAFKKCGKATFQALHRLDHGQDADAEIFDLVTYLALALRKFTLEFQGLWKVTESDLSPGDPVYHLFHGIVKKYDSRLHHEDEMFHTQARKELDYISHTFGPMELNVEDMQQAIHYKDAMALREVIAALLYHEDYVIRGFECSRLCSRGRHCLRNEVDTEGHQPDGERPSADQ